MKKAISIYIAINKVMRSPTYKINNICNVEASKLLIKIKDIFETITTSHYKNWIARKRWTIFEASCLFNGLDQSIFEELNKTLAVDIPSDSKMPIRAELDIINTTISLISDIRREAKIMLTWLPKQDRCNPKDDVTEAGTETEEDPLKLINKYLITLGKVPKEMLTHAKKAFLLLYQSKDANEDTRKNWQDNWHTIAPRF